MLSSIEFNTLTTRVTQRCKHAHNVDYPTFKQLDSSFNSRIGASQAIRTDHVFDKNETESHYGKLSRSRPLTRHAVVSHFVQCPKCLQNHFLSKYSEIHKTPASQHLE